MSSVVRSKSKLSRTCGVNLWGKQNDAFEKKPYIPGQHGGKIMRMAKTYRKQLIEKNKMRFFHVLNERQFSNIVIESIASRHNSTETLVQTLNVLLSSVIYTSGMFASVFFVRQIIVHRHVNVNGRSVYSPTYRLKVGDVITFSEKIRKNKQVSSYIAAKTLVYPSYMNVDITDMSITLINLPSSESVKYPCEMQPNIVVEYYSV